jgi:pimeloyl-ACP methyl ester carboxylesterase
VPGTESAHGRPCCARQTTTASRSSICANPASDPEVTLLSARSRETFVAATSLLDTPAEAVSIAYEGTTLPGYLFLVDDSGTPRPTVIYTNGYDFTAEEAYSAIAAAALRCGYNVLAFDGPGQGAALREQKLVFQPDWEAVSTPVIDYARTRPEIAADKIVLFGYSMGGYLIARAAAFDQRIAALILDDGIYDFHTAFTRPLPPFLASWIADQVEIRLKWRLACRSEESRREPPVA